MHWRRWLCPHKGATPLAYLEGPQAQLTECIANEDDVGAAAVKEEMRVASAKQQARERTRRGELETKLAEMLAREDYFGAAAVKEEMRLYAVTTVGHGSQTATGPMVAAGTSARDARAKRVEEEEQEEERQAKLRCARDQLKKCIEAEDYMGAAAAKAKVSELMGAELCSQRSAASGSVAGQRPSSLETLAGRLSSIKDLSERLPSVCAPVQLEGVTLLAVGKVSEAPRHEKGAGKGEQGKKGKKGKKGKAPLQPIQPVYFGDGLGNVICTLATGNSISRIPAAGRENAYVDITALKPQAGELGVLYWTENTQMTLRLQPGDSGPPYVFPYDTIAEYSNNFASMTFAQECEVGTYVAIAMRVTDVQPKWTVDKSEPYMQLMGVDTEGVSVGPLRLWKYEEIDIELGNSYVVRGLRVNNDRVWNEAKWMWIRSAEAPKIVECSVRSAIEDVTCVDAVTQYF